MIDIYKLPLDDYDTWKLIQSGRTIGVFQLDSKLAQNWCEKILPNNIEELAAVISLIRPGCLKAMEPDEEGKMKSLTQHYADRKNGKELVEFIHPVVDKILQPTYGILVYQEQSMQLAVDCAGFSLEEADSLRKAAGKKDAELMAKVKSMFIEKSHNFNVIDDELATKLFSWIEKSNRYSFNKSHAVGYALQGYYNAYLKTHYPRQFFCSWLHYGLKSQDPFDEIMRVANDARLFNIDVKTPDIRLGNKNFKENGDQIVCGLIAIKGIGPSQIVKMKEATKDLPDTPIWNDILMTVSDKVSSTCMTNLIKSGGLDFCTETRKKMLRDYDLWNELTQKEKANIKNICVSLYGSVSNAGQLSDILKGLAKTKKEGGICANKNRVAIIEGIIKQLEKATYSLDDTPSWIANMERQLIGLSITCSPVDSCDTYQANCSCKEFVNNEVNFSEGYCLAVNIQGVRELKIKNGKNIGKKMAYLTVGDSSGIISNVVAFADEYEKFADMIYEDNNVLIQGNRDKKQNSLIVRDIQQLSNAH